MASLALSLQVRGNTIEDARVVFGGIAGKPLRERAVESFLRGKTLSADLGDQAVAIALANAAPLKYNATKIDMAKGLLASGLAKLNAANSRAFCSSPSAAWPNFRPSHSWKSPRDCPGEKNKRVSRLADPTGTYST